MTRFERWLRNKAERFLGRFYEGPSTPDRLPALVDEFIRLYPHATRQDWTLFAIKLSDESYRSGYVRGFEYVERAPETWRPDVPPEVLADMIDPDWRWRPMDRGIESDPQYVVPEENDDVKRVNEELERVKQWFKSKR